MHLSRTRVTVVPFVIGVVTAVVCNRVTGWWLNSGGGVATTMVVLLAVSAILARVCGATAWVAAAWLWAGAMAGMVAVLFREGPGTIWPIVVAIAGVFTAAAVAAGTAAGRPRRQP